MTIATWTKAERFDGDGALIAADLDNGARAVIYGEYQDEIKISLLIFDSSLPGGSASTERTQDWPLVEQYIPRAEWPAEIWGGYRGPAERTPAPEVAAAVAQYVAAVAQYVAETNAWLAED